MRNAYTILFGEPVRKGLLESPECRRKGTNKMGFKEIDCERGDLVHLTANIAQYIAFVNTEMNFWTE
jgi:hypothetical protein